MVFKNVISKNYHHTQSASFRKIFFSACDSKAKENLCGIRFGYLFEKIKKLNRIPDKFAFLRQVAKMRIFRNDALCIESEVFRSAIVIMLGGLAALLLLTSCATPPTVTKPVTVEVPVAVPCRAPVVLHPVWPFQAATTQNSTMFVQIRALLAENELRQAYEAQLEAAVAACR